jgi:coproporphyrinogen III oxidase-like Fe-S oxidoreductase
MNPGPFDDYFRHAPPALNLDELRREWLALEAPYDVNRWRLPLPPWAERGYDQTGPQAWDMLRHDLAESSAADAAKPLCIYLHVPFCSRKCGFCDSYSFKLGGHQADAIQQYVDRLCYELRLWSAQGSLSKRPVSTVHMGGGTPTFLGEAALTQLVECCRECFAISPATEWALESTVEALTPGMIATMHTLGYRRLHIGVQSLQDPVRAEIGRHRSRADVLECIESTLALGWIVSVDMVCGLPFQTFEGFIDDLETLITAGINGFSLYELLIYPQNRRWAESHNLTRRSHVSNFFMLTAGASLLETRGFGKNLFNHWADARDANIYFTFPTRGEDLLAVGTIADGVFGDYHYRHPRYAPYLRESQAGLPGLIGGLRRNALEKRVQPLTTSILSGFIESPLLPDSLATRWLQNALVKPDPRGGLALTYSGAWFAGNLIADVMAQYSALTG